MHRVKKKDAQDLVSKLLVVDPSERMSAEEILQHAWFQGDKEVMNQAELLMGLQGSGDFVSCEEDVDTDSGRGSMMGTLCRTNHLREHV